jgi:hypothetical protein
MLVTLFKKPAFKSTKGEHLFAFAWVVGADGIEPPTYAV